MGIMEILSDHSNQTISPVVQVLYYGFLFTEESVK